MMCFTFCAMLHKYRKKALKAKGNALLFRDSRVHILPVGGGGGGGAGGVRGGSGGAGGSDAYGGGGANAPSHGRGLHSHDHLADMQGGGQRAGSEAASPNHSPRRQGRRSSVIGGAAVAIWKRLSLGRTLEQLFDEADAMENDGQVEKATELRARAMEMTAMQHQSALSSASRV